MNLRISIDDGDLLDRKSADLLKKYNLVKEACFYVAPFYDGKDKEEQWKIQDLTKELSDEGFEIGGHTYTHCLIRQEPYDKKIEEINSGKEFIEELTGKKITKFAYPKGWYDDETKRAVRTCGFTEARTMKMEVTDIKGYDKFEIPVTEHVYPDRIKGLLNDNFYSLVWHSWEVEKFNLWETLEIQLKKINEYKNSLT